MRILRDNLLVQFSIVSLVIMFTLAMALSFIVTAKLNRDIDLLKDHGATMMAGVMIKDTDPFSIPSLTADVANLRMITYISFAGGFVYLYGSLFLIVWRGWKIISRQRGNLESLNAQLGERVTEGVEDLRSANALLRLEVDERSAAETRLEGTLEELQNMQKQLVQQERMQAMGQMASGVAHDFNNALAPIVFYADMLLDIPGVMDNKEDLSEYLRTMRTSARDATKVVSRLREFYRGPQSGDTLESVNVNEVIESSIDLTQPRWRIQAQAGGQSIDIDTDLDEVPAVSINSSELREVLTNMIMNAVDAMSDGGNITFRTRIEGEEVVIEVSDTGNGMSEEACQRCMDPFFTTKGERGTGLGLSMSFGIIQRSHGTIEVDSELGKGTTFVIRLPSGAAAQTESEYVGSSNPPRSLHILVVDDDSTGLRALTQALHAVGHTVDAAANGREGLEKFQARKYDLVVTDRAMPEMNGDQLAAVIKEISPDMRVIMITGLGDIMSGQGERPFGVDLVMTKPVGLADLQGALLTLGV